MDFSHSLAHSFFRRCLTNCSSRRQLFTVLGRLSIWNFEKLYYWKADVLLDFSMFSFLWVLVILKLRRKKVCIIITDVLLTVVAGEKCINSVLLAYMQQTSLMRCTIQFYFLVISLNRHLVPCGFQCFTHLVPCGFQCFTHCNVTDQLTWIVLKVWNCYCTLSGCVSVELDWRAQEAPLRNIPNSRVWWRGLCMAQKGKETVDMSSVC